MCGIVATLIQFQAPFNIKKKEQLKEEVIKDDCKIDYIQTKRNHSYIKLLCINQPSDAFTVDLIV